MTGPLREETLPLNPGFYTHGNPVSATRAPIVESTQAMTSQSWEQPPVTAPVAFLTTPARLLALNQMKGFWGGIAIGFISGLLLLFLAVVYSSQISFICYELVLGVAVAATLYVLFARKPYQLAAGILIGTLLGSLGLVLLLGTP